MDIETAADLTNESSAKPAKVKSKGITHTLVMEAITLKSLGKKSRIYLDSNCATQTFKDMLYVSWTSNSGRRNPLQLTLTDSKLKQSNAILQIMLPLLGFL